MYNSVAYPALLVAVVVNGFFAGDALMVGSLLMALAFLGIMSLSIALAYLWSKLD